MPAARLQSGDLVLPARLVIDTGLIAQKLDRRLRTILGTWPEDDAVGLPWDRWIADPRRLTPAILAAAVRAQIARMPEVVQVVTCRATQAAGTITLTASAIVRVGGETGTITVTTDPLVRVGAPPLLIVRGL
jgi:hypothetical protein